MKTAEKTIQDIQREISDWEAYCLENGRYRHEDNLREFGFPYKSGDFVPTSERYSAMILHNSAIRMREKWSSYRKP